MTTTSIFGTVSELLGAGGGVWIATQLSKMALWVKLDGDQTKKIQATAAVLSAVAVGLLGIANQNLQPTDLTHIVTALGAFAATWGLSHGLHKMVGTKVFTKPTEPVVVPEVAKDDNQAVQ